MKLNELKLKTYYIIIHKETQELLFDERVFVGKGPAKNAFRQKRYGRRGGKSFDEQDEYILVPIELSYKTIEDVK